MMKIDVGLPYYFDWLVQNLSPSSKIGFDPSQLPIASFKARSKYFAEKGFELYPVSQYNLVDKVWGEERPVRPTNKVFVHEEKYSGSSVQDRINLVRKCLAKSVDVLVVSQLDDIAWLLNLRGSDIDYNPVFFSYLTFYVPSSDEEAVKIHLFINSAKVSDEQVQK